ncbi:MAG: 4'-phosphopantetheinyl transferase superfamily protein [Trueperaceae bacterium]|nr:4'-phosphopantetheinyl transferase superfamily protein [Trueperaceae bacterium]
MIVAVGIDVANLERLRAVWQRHPERFLYRHFTPEEIRYCRSKADPLQSIGARFSAKEAFQKCWPETHGWQDVWVEMEGVKPVLKFSPEIQAEMNKRGWVAHLSLTHDKDMAAAVVVLERP